MTGPRPYILRAAVEADHRLIYSSWVTHQGEFEPWASIGRPDYLRWQHELVRRCLASYPTRVACFAEEPDLIQAWVNFTLDDPGSVDALPVVNWIWVRKEHREVGLASQLLADVFGPEWRTRPVVATGWSRECLWIRRKVGLRHDPALWASVVADCHGYCASMKEASRINEHAMCQFQGRR